MNFNSVIIHDSSNVIFLYFHQQYIGWVVIVTKELLYFKVLNKSETLQLKVVSENPYSFER